MFGLSCRWSLPFQQVSPDQAPKTRERLNDLAARTGDRQQIRGVFVKITICVARDRRPEGTIHAAEPERNLEDSMSKFGRHEMQMLSSGDIVT